MVKIERINFRYHLGNALFISFAWTISLSLMVLNRNYGIDYILFGKTARLIQISSMLWIITFTGIFLGITSSLFEFYFSGKKLGKLSHGVAILIKAMVYILLLLAVGVIVYKGIDYFNIEFIYESTLGDFLFSFKFLPMFLYLLFTSLFINVLIHVERILGRGNLVRFITGKYLKPIEVDRIFMFLDVNDSTKLAEEWGHLKMSAFLQDFFTDLSELIIPYQGEIYQFVGDEAVISWPLKKDKAKNTLCIRLYYTFREQLNKKRSCYIGRYRQIPEFKAGINCGTVVISEVGKYKVELAYHGDVMNTTARMASQCRILEKPLLISESMYRNMECDHYKVESIGEAQFRGKEIYTNLYYIYPDPNNQENV